MTKAILETPVMYIRTGTIVVDVPLPHQWLQDSNVNIRLRALGVPSADSYTVLVEGKPGVTIQQDVEVSPTSFIRFTWVAKSVGT